MVLPHCFFILGISFYSQNKKGTEWDVPCRLPGIPTKPLKSCGDPGRKTFEWLHARALDHSTPYLGTPWHPLFHTLPKDLRPVREHERQLSSTGWSYRNTSILWRQVWHLCKQSSLFGITPPLEDNSSILCKVPQSVWVNECTWYL